MSKLFATSNVLGSFDFYSSLVEIRNYTKSAKEVLEQALTESLPEAWDKYWPVRVNFRSLVAHEITHFNDCFTTTWGIEFQHRKLRLIKLMNEGQDADEPLSVFYLNVSELRSHKELTKIGDRTLSLATSMTHQLEVDDRFGPLIYIDYNLNGQMIQRVPLSLLAVMEAHAFANETLVKIVSAEALRDCSEKTEYLANVDADFIKVLDDNSRSEYTVLLTLAKLHFKELSLKQLLVFVATLCRFTMDLNDLALAKVSYYIEGSINNLYAGKTLCQDMRRGSSRAVIMFKTILFMYGWIKTSNFSTRSHIVSLLKIDPLAAILKFWTRADKDFPMLYRFGDDFLFEFSLSSTLELADSVQKEIINSCSLYNRNVLKGVPLGLCDIKDLRLLDVFLSDETEIRVPNRIDLSISDYFIDYSEMFSEVEECSKKAVEKFFMRPGDFIAHVNPFEV